MPFTNPVSIQHQVEELEMSIDELGSTRFHPLVIFHELFQDGFLMIFEQL